jgi:hypothetical protein
MDGSWSLIHRGFGHSLFRAARTGPLRYPPSRRPKRGALTRHGIKVAVSNMAVPGKKQLHPEAIPSEIEP